MTDLIASCGGSAVAEVVCSRDLPARGLFDERPIPTARVSASEDSADHGLSYACPLPEAHLRLARAFQVLIQRHASTCYPFQDQVSIRYRIDSRLSVFG